MKNAPTEQSLPRLLIVEDDPAFQSSGLEVFKNAFRVDQAFDYQEAKIRVEASTFDAVLLDPKLPGGEGLQLIRRIREKKPAAPIILIVDDSEADVDIAAFHAGATDFFNPPFDFQFLLKRLQLLLKMTAGNNAFQTLPKDLLDSGGPSKKSGLPKMLVVDDEDGPAQTIEIIFKEEFEVTTAACADDALNLLQQQHFDVIISDIRMPGMDGIELLQKIRERDAHVPVILNTAYETSDTLLAAIRLQATDYISKPFDIQTIRKSVANALQRSRTRN